jgi:hypothetical protein
VTVDPVPHQLGNQPSDVAVRRHPPELRHADAVLVAVDLVLEPATPVDVERLAAHAAQPRVLVHEGEHPGEVAGRQVEVQVELDDEVVVVEVDVRQPGSEGADDARAEHPAPGPRVVDHPRPGHVVKQLLQQLGGAVRRAVVDHDPRRGGLGLAQDAGDAAGQELLLVAARADDAETMGRRHGPVSTPSRNGEVTGCVRRGKKSGFREDRGHHLRVVTPPTHVTYTGLTRRMSTGRRRARGET